MHFDFFDNKNHLPIAIRRLLIYSINFKLALNQVPASIAAQDKFAL